MRFRTIIVSLLAIAMLAVSTIAGAGGPDRPRPDLPEDHFLNDTGFVPEIGPEHIATAEAFGVTPEEAKEIMNRQSRQDEAYIKLYEKLGDKVISGAAYNLDFFESDELTIHASDKAAKGLIIAEIAKSTSGFDNAKTIVKIAKEGPQPTDNIPDRVGEKLNTCDYDGGIEGGRVQIMRAQNNSFDNRGTHSGCDAFGPYHVATTGYSVMNASTGEDGWVLAGHSVHENLDYDTCNLSYALYGGDKTFTSYGRGTVIQVHDGYYHDFAICKEAAEAVPVRPRIYMSGSVWRSVVNQAWGEYYSIGKRVCMKLGGRVWATFNNHPSAVRCATIRDDFDGGQGMADSNSFRFQMDNNISLFPGDSGSGVYFLNHDGTVRMYGVLHSRHPDTHYYGYAEKSHEISLKSGGFRALTVNDGIR